VSVSIEQHKLSSVALMAVQYLQTSDKSHRKTDAERIHRIHRCQQWYTTGL